jgi:hypothetical protein
MRARLFGGDSMTVATKMTVDEFLKSDPTEHPDFVGCQDEFKHPGPQPMPMPNLVALIRRIGGPDAIPDAMDAPHLAFIPDLHDAQIRYGVFLLDRKTHIVYAELSRMGPRMLQVSHWHPRERFLDLIFELPADWAAGTWAGPCTCIMDQFSSSPDLDALAMASCDRFLGLIQQATETCCLIRRDVFIP